ncbi:hypothetical protein ACOMHN_016762 [Nucella lapillus]
MRAQHKHTTYDLAANIVHVSEPGGGQGGTYRCHVLHKATGKWYEMQDLHVADILPQMITLTESYIQIYEWRENTVNPFYQPASAKKGAQQGTESAEDAGKEAAADAAAKDKGENQPVDGAAANSSKDAQKDQKGSRHSEFS